MHKMGEKGEWIENEGKRVHFGADEKKKSKREEEKRRGTDNSRTKWISLWAKMKRQTKNTRHVSHQMFFTYGFSFQLQTPSSSFSAKSTLSFAASFFRYFFRSFFIFNSFRVALRRPNISQTPNERVRNFVCESAKAFAIQLNNARAKQTKQRRRIKSGKKRPK